MGDWALNGDWASNGDWAGVGGAVGLTVTHVTDAAILVTVTRSHTADAGVGGFAEVLHTTDALMGSIVSLTATVDLKFDPSVALTEIDPQGLRNLGAPDADARAIGQTTGLVQFSAVNPALGRDQFGLRNYRKPVRITEKDGGNSQINPLFGSG